MSYTNSRDSFIEADQIGCGTQLKRKVPPDENNFSWARLSLLRCLRPVENKTREAESPLSFPTHVWNFDLKYSINSLLEPVTRPVISRRTHSYSEEIRQEKDVHWKRNQDLQDQDSAHNPRTSGGVGVGLCSTSPVFSVVLSNLLVNSIHIQECTLLTTSNISGIYCE